MLSSRTRYQLPYKRTAHCYFSGVKLLRNRLAAAESGVRTEYQSNSLNRYSAEGRFCPEFDAAGNQTLIRTSTGEWNVTYNAKNRPIRFEKEDGSIVVECTYDTMGRRATKKVTTNGTLTEHRRFLYRGYLQIACCDLLRPSTPVLWAILWDPTQPTATRPLAIQKNRTWYTYGWDLTKNICETYRTDGRIDNTYAYTPYGEVTPAHADTQPLRWSSEYHDPELGLVYYNYRHYNPAMGRWMGRDTIQSGNLYSFVHSNPCVLSDALGLVAPGIEVYPVVKQWNNMHETNAFNNAIFYEINSTVDALMYYKSKRGGIIPAGPQLIEQIIRSSGHQDNLKDLRILLKKKLLENCQYEMCTQSSGTWHNPGGTIAFYTGSNAVGHVDFYVQPYDVYWVTTKMEGNSNAGYTTVVFVSLMATRRLSFSDHYIFDPVSRPQQIFTDLMPGIIAGEGTPYHIIGSFTDSVTSDFSFSCCG